MYGTHLLFSRRSRLTLVLNLRFYYFLRDVRNKSQYCFLKLRRSWAKIEKIFYSSLNRIVAGEKNTHALNAYRCMYREAMGVNRMEFELKMEITWVGWRISVRLAEMGRRDSRSAQINSFDIVSLQSRVPSPLPFLDNHFGSSGQTSTQIN